MNKIIAIVGPTCSGKSDIAIEIAKKINGEIINADSLQVYQNFPILLACPKNFSVSHYLYEFVEPTYQINVEFWRERASVQINKVLISNKIPIIVGGTGFYIKSLFYGLSKMPKIDLDIKNRIRNIAKNSNDFYTYALSIDNKICGKINPNDVQRLSRAVEVFIQTGKSIYDFIEENPKKSQYDGYIFNLTQDRDILYKQINNRCIQMIQNGAIEEVVNYINIANDAGIRSAIGFNEIECYLKNQIQLDAAIDIMQKRTRNYAKRQITWFKNQFKEIINVESAHAVQIILNKLAINQ